jgi:dihydroorotase
MAARERGVIFDIGHGFGSCGFATSRAMLAAGFLPDVISSDVHVLSINGPAFDLLQTLAKFHALGMSMQEVVACATVNAARAIRRTELGSLKVGALGDASVFEVIDEPTPYTDVTGEVITGEKRFAARGLVLDGAWWR